MKDVKRSVREQYGKIASAAKTPGGCCSPSCCGGGKTQMTSCAPTSEKLGYSDEELSAVPAGADLGLGCGNPQAIADLKAGQTVLDLGSGAGIDCFLAARQVGPAGKVIGVDMTAEMIELARENARQAGAENVEFRLGEIEHLPVADATVDVILSNCVVNLSPEKPAVFRDAFRVLTAGGRLAISDVVATSPLPQEVRDSVELHVGCIAGAATVDDVRAMLEEAGFVDIHIDINERSRETIRDWLPGMGLENYVASATIQATRPAS